VRLGRDWESVPLVVEEQEELASAVGVFRPTLWSAVDGVPVEVRFEMSRAVLRTEVLLQQPLYLHRSLG
jgi:hypothetical protein